MEVVMVHVIHARDIEKRYLDKTTALRKINFSVAKGDRFVLLGPNGAGKSSLVKILSTLSRATGGSATVNGIDCCNAPRSVRMGIGVALQDICLDPDETVIRHLYFQGRLFGMSRTAAQRRCDTLVSSFGFAEDARKKTKELSGGNKRRLHIALALVHDPDILFLDEPTVGMDPEGREGFWNEIRRLNESGVTVFLTTQYLEEADKHFDRMAVISDGVIVYDGHVRSFKKMVESEILLQRGDTVSPLHIDNMSTSLEDGYLHFIKNIRSEHE